MNAPLRICCWLLWGMMAALCSAEPSADQAAGEPWKSRGFMMGQDFWTQTGPFSQFADWQKGESLPKLPELPAENARDEAWVLHIKETTEVLKEYFEKLGIKTPPGTAFAFDAKSGTLAVRTRADAMEQVEEMEKDVSRRSPEFVVCLLHLIQADGPTIRQVIETAQGHEDLTADWKRLQKLIDSGKAKLLQTCRVDSRSGPKVNLDVGPQIQQADGFKVSADGHVDWKRKQRNTGLHFEVEPVIGPNDWDVSLTMTMEYHFAPPTKRVGFAGDGGGLGRIEVPLLDFHRVRINSAMEFGNGMTRLMGAWKPQGAPGFDQQDVLQAAFLNVVITRSLPTTKNEKLPNQLLRYVDQVAPIPAFAVPAAPTPNVPPGMAQRVFKLPPDFFSEAIGDAEPPISPPGDPFTQTSSRKGCITAPLLLQMAGIPFPDGASAIYSHSTLTVTNTTEALDAIDVYLNAMPYNHTRALLHTLLIVQADGATMRRLTEATMTTDDHTAVLRQLQDLVVQGKASIVNTLCAETWSGQRFSIMTGADRMHVENFRESENASGVEADLPTKFYGTELSIDPVLGPGGLMPDISFNLKHELTPPTEKKLGGEKNGTTRQLPLTTEETHEANLESGATLRLGTVRLIGLWNLNGPSNAKDKDKDLMQAAFLRIDRPIIDREWIEKRKKSW